MCKGAWLRLLIPMTVALIASTSSQAAGPDRATEQPTGATATESNATVEAASTSAPAARPGNDGNADATEATEAAREKQTAWQPTTYSADYRVRYEGVPFSVNGTRSLSRDEDGRYHFRSRIKTFLARLEESSTFTQDAQGELRSQEYRERRSGLAGSRDRQVTFDWEQGRVYRHDSDREHDLEGPVYDPVSWQLALQQDLAQGDAERGDIFEYAVSKGGEPDHYRIQVRGEQDIEVPAGTLQTLMLERIDDPDGDQTRIWVAPEHDHLLVRLEHDDGRLLTLALKEFD